LVIAIGLVTSVKSLAVDVVCAILTVDHPLLHVIWTVALEEIAIGLSIGTCSTVGGRQQIHCGENENAAVRCDRHHARRIDALIGSAGQSCPDQVSIAISSSETSSAQA
jgi:hypothetical protein